jgi:2-oxoisovalerate dehydrogenase E1 component
MSLTRPKRSPESDSNVDRQLDWRRVAWLIHASRAMDEIEETKLVPERKVFYQFSARGHDLAQIILGLQLTSVDDAICGYYRSRPILLSLGVSLADALGSSMGRAGGYSDGRDIGAVFNYPNPNGPSALPMCGGVGAQYTPTVGWAQALEYRRTVLNDTDCGDAIGVALGGDASVATNGFWSALTIATTQNLPMLFYIEDNGYGISVPSTVQTPGGDIAANLKSFKNLHVISGDGTIPEEAARLAAEAVRHVRSRRGPALLRLTVPRLEGHSFQDTQTYKPAETIAAENARDPLPKLRAHLVPAIIDEAEWKRIAADAKAAVDTACREAEARPTADLNRTTRNVLFEG